MCGDIQVASAQTLDRLDIGQKSSFPDWRLSPNAKSFPDGYELFSPGNAVPAQFRHQCVRQFVRRTLRYRGNPSFADSAVVRPPRASKRKKGR
ncbi:hypothetical protein TRIP_B330192 [uncultured Desulfatiglans sp.]|uniref:Uncharacterized protein n=1 Tax=Uncultured Desulfatiglans sp. TaxID=1748965 RepID=A0A653A7Q2_UNCDX|nr:hypothetical protein TRIP_B330192 [uncultured Desulfatiglans sp.]